MHLGAYWDPGMACDLPADLTTLTQQQLEEKFNEPFNKDSTGIRIVKSHIFSYENNIRYLREQFVDCAIVLVHRSDDACLGWWVKCGHFDITYPSYAGYYQNLKNMASIIKQQNAGIVQAQDRYRPNMSTVHNNRELARALGIELPPLEYEQYYHSNDIKVTVI
jgi:hypothetical protein